MWQRFLYCVSSCILLIGCGSTEKIPPSPPILCSILSLESRAGMKAGEAESVTDMFSSALQNTGRFTVVERNKLNAVLQEQGFQATQNGEDAVKAGKILSVRKMFSGSIGKLGEKYVVNLKMIDVETSRVEYARIWTYDDDLEDIGEKFLPKLVQEFIKSLDSTLKK
jgi:TolB-like protein